MIHPDLPEVCFALHPDTGEVIGIMRGEPGYSLPGNVPEHLKHQPGKALTKHEWEWLAQERGRWVEGRNRAMGVTPAQREAMIAGSMFDWHLPIADPAKHANAE